MDVFVRPAARADLAHEALYLAERTVAAERFVLAADATFQALGEAPLLGESLSCGTRELRVWRIRGFANHLVFYCVAGERLEILRVLHAAQNWRSILEQ